VGAINALAELQIKVNNKTAQVGVVGLGYVGLPLALGFARKGFRTTGFDIDPAKVEKLGRGETYIGHIPATSISQEVNRGHFEATSDYARLREMDAIIICVPTPLNEHRDPDLSYIRNTAEAISAHLRRGQLVVLESTTYPGTTDEVVLPILERSGLHCPLSPYATDGRTVQAGHPVGGDFLLAFSPEREDPGNKQFQTHQIPKVIGGVNGASALAARALYDQVFERTLLVSSARAAEMTKLLENIYRCVNIALVNELKLLCLRMGIDIWEVIEAAKTKPFGFTAFYPGPGLGRRWALHPHRPFLSDLESPRIRISHPLHRTSRRNQLRHAGTRGSESGRRAEPPQAVPAGGPHPDPGRGLQEGY
jgi:UDP-N-acetyl-D-glucosamine dehydrogenase